MKFVVQRNRAPLRIDDFQFYLILLAVMAALVAALVTSFAMILHRNFLSIACDTAVIQSGIVNTMHGHWFANNGAGGPNILGSHTTFALLFLVPFYTLYPSVEMLFTLQVFGTYSAVIPIYLVAQVLLRRPILAFAIAGSALISPLFVHMALAPLHMETWIVAAVFWSYYFYRRDSLIGFCASFLFAVCCGEQAAMIYVALGLALIVVNDGLEWHKRFGAVSIVGGFGWVFFAVLVVAPLARSSSNGFNIFAYNYSQWHVRSFAELPWAVALQPRMAYHFLVNPYRWAHVLEVIGLPLVCALLTWRSFLLLAPVPVYLLMSDQEFYLYFHAYYYSFAFIAGYLGALFFLSRREGADRISISVVVLIVLSNIILLCTTSAFYINFSECRDDEFTASLRSAFLQIPPEATVYTAHRYSAYLSNRENMVIGDLSEEHFDFDLMMDARYSSTNVHPGQVDYIVVDFITDQCGCRQGGYDPVVAKRRSDNINSLLQTNQWQMAFNQNNTVILRRLR